MSGKEHPAEPGGAQDDTGDQDSTNLIKRLIDNQPLSDTHKVRDERRGERRQYGAHAVDSAHADDDQTDATRGSDG